MLEAQGELWDFKLMKRSGSLRGTTVSLPTQPEEADLCYKIELREIDQTEKKKKYSILTISGPHILFIVPSSKPSSRLPDPNQ